MTGADRRGEVVVARAARPDDVPALVALARVCNPSPWSSDAIAARIDDASAFVRVLASDRDGVVGWVIGAVAGEDAEIHDIGVSPAHRRRGHARQLVELALRAAADAGASALFLEVRDSNAGARALYAAMEFVEVGVRRRYYRSPVEDARVLRRSVMDGG